MWSTFFLASLVCMLLFYVVGFFFLKAFRFSTLFSLAAAPLVSTVCFELLAIVYDKVDFFTTGWNLFVPVVVLSLVVFGVNLALQRRENKGSSAGAPQFKKPSISGAPRFKNPLAAFDAKMVLLYVGLGLFVGFFVLVRLLDGPECFNETFDNITHLGLVRSFLETGHYSTLNASISRDLGAVGSFYPAAWHLIAAMSASITGASNLLVTNAINYACCSVVYPISCLCLMRALFGDKKNYLIAGAFVCIGFVTFPWFFVVYGTLESNLLGFIMVPVLLVAVMKVVAPKATLLAAAISAGEAVNAEGTQEGALKSKGAPKSKGTLKLKGMPKLKGAMAERIKYLCLCLIGVIFCFFTQPNTFFAVMLFSIPYLCMRIWQASGVSAKGFSKPKRIGLVAAFLLAMAAIWCVCYKAPFFFAVTHFIWPPVASKSQGVINMLLFSNSWSPAAVVIAVLVFAGLLAMLKMRAFGWLAVTLGITSLIYWSGVSLEGTIDQLLSGFWYSDWRRTAALQAIIAVPVAAIGLAHLYEALPAFLKTNRVLKVALACILLAVIFYPNFNVRGIVKVQTPFGYFAEMMDEYYSMDQTDDEIIFSSAEREFSQKVKDIVGDDVVINIPYDGSMLAYQVNGVRTLQRLPYVGPGTTADQKAIQAYLYDYAYDPAVQAAVKNLGAKYVLQLDAGHIPYHRTWPDFIPENWEGISEITEDTPGFELVLSEGDMRLFKIKDLD